MGETRTSVREVIPDVGGRFSLDENIVNFFPKGSEVIEVISFGTAAWTRASRITVELPDGAQDSYFLKCATEELGRAMMAGEHRSMTEIYSYMPEFVPKPVTRGKFKQAPPETFYLMDFLELGPDLLEPPDFCRLIAQLHEMSVSPTGKFRFHQSTFQGPRLQNTTWESNWCTYFTRLMTEFFEREIAQNGPQPDYEAAYKKFAQEVVPQILEPLQSDGRVLKPSLIHGDIHELFNWCIVYQSPAYTPDNSDMSDQYTRLSDLQTAGSSEEASAKFENADNDDLPGVEAPYTIFTNPQKLDIVLLIAFASLYSPLSNFICYPALATVAHDLHTTLSKVNLTITSYMIVSGVAPMILGSIADQSGRRPVYLLMFFVYILANVGLAGQTSYPALLLLRMLQSAGGSATIGIGYGVVGDITESSERGAYMGILGCGPNVAPGLGPVLGGILAQKAGWRWIFGFLAISGALSLALIAVVLPETARNIVGNGSRPATGLNKSILTLWQEKKNTRSNGHQGGAPEDIPQHVKLKIPNPIGSISIFLCKDTAPVVLVYAVFYNAYSCLQASLSSLFINIYGYRELEAGLIYIPFGVGCFIASLLSRNNAVWHQAKILTNDYRCIATRQGLPMSNDNTAQSQALAFPIFHARLRSMNYLLPLSTLSLLAYGWVLEYHLHPSIPLVLQFFIGGSITIIFNACGTLLVDLHPSRPSTAQASLNMVRCTLAADGLAALQPLINAVGVGWRYTMIALVTGGMTTACVILGRAWGENWRRQRQGSQSGEESR